MKLTELFDNAVNYQWTNINKYIGTAVFEIGTMTYQVDIEEDEVDNRFWHIGFGAKTTNAAVGTPDSYLTGDNTGTGNQYAVYSTVIAATRDFMEQHGVRPIRIIALDDSRKSLYPRMLKRLLPDWSVTTAAGNIIAVPPK